MDSGTWSWGGLSYDEDEEEEDNFSEEVQTQWSNKDSIVFLVDCNPTMFDKNEEGVSHFSQTMQCIMDAMSSKVFTSDSDFVAVVFYSTVKKSNSNDHENVYIVHELGQASAERIQFIERLKDDQSDFDQYGQSEKFSIYDALWTCNTMFSNSSLKVGSKRIFLFTNQDNPHSDDANLRRLSKTKAQDIRDIGIEIELIHMASKEKPFELNNFYSELLALDEDQILSFPSATTKLGELQDRMRYKQFKKRAMMRIPWTLGEGFDIGVQVYKMICSTKKPSFIRLEAKTNEPVKLVTSNICAETGAQLMTSDIKRSYLYGGKNVIFEPDEAKKIKYFDDPGFKLMGFKDKSFLRRHFHVKSCDFVYPDESVIVGSTKLFKALLDECLTSEKYPICRLIPRANAAPRFICLLPQEEERDECNNQCTPPGFHVLYLPYDDDLRDLKFQELEEPATDEQVEKMEEIVSTFILPYDPRSIENPTLQRHYRALECTALNRDQLENFEDTSLPDTAGIDDAGGALMEEWCKSVYGDDYDPTAFAAKAPAKRKAPAPKKPAKKEKTEDGGGGDGITEFKAYQANGELAGLTVKDLKAFLSSVGQKVSGKKADLVTRIEEYLATV